MRCPKCQFENRAGAKFCRNCGGGLELRCPSCGSPYEPDSAFCDECGRSLTSTKPPLSLDYSQPHSYTPRFLADKILTNRQSIEGERKLVTVLFADVANYTSMSEKLDLEEVRQVMDGCFQAVMDEIHRYEGTIDKFTGDGVMALFGAPVAHEDHAQRACYAALAIQKAVGEYGDKVKKDHGIDFRMRVGLHCGPVIVGSVARSLKMDYTAIGDTVNLASRMETMAEPGRILATADVHRMAHDFFSFRSRGRLSVKGKEEAVEAYELLEPTEVASRIEASILRGLTRFVGREKELAILNEAWEQARSGAGHVVCIVGEAGVGKSRLLLEFRRSLSEDQSYLEGHCLHYGSSMPYLPVLDILRSGFGLKEGERESVVRKKLEEKTSALGPGLKEALPPLQDLLSLKVEEEAYLNLEPQRKRERTFEAVRDVLITASQQRPLVIAVEDLHWIDRTSEDFLTYLIGHLPGSRILLLLLYRPEYNHQWASKSCYSQIRVDELPAKSSAELVRAMLEEGEVAPELRELILNRASGNPLFMEEFTQNLLENGSIQKRDHGYVLSCKASEINVPDTIQGIVAARMDRLDDNLKRIMQVASVIGRDFAYRILQTITGMQEELKSHLVNLQGLEFIYEKSLYPELEYVFKHALTQEVAYNSLLLKRRKQIHERIGKAIEELYPDRLEEFCEVLAHHYSRADDLESAARYLKLSAEKAERGCSAREAYEYYGETLKVLGRLPDTERTRLDIIGSMVSLMFWLNFPDNSIPILEEGIRIADQLGDRPSALALYGGIGGAYTMAGNAAEALRFNQMAFDEAERLGDNTAMVWMAASLSASYSVLVDAVKTADVCRRALAALERGKVDPRVGGGMDAQSQLLSFLGWARALLGDFDEGEQLCNEALERALETDSEFSLAMAHLHVAATAWTRGRPETLLRQAREASRLCDKTQQLMMSGICWLFQAYAHYYLGELAEARKCAEKSITVNREHGGKLHLSRAYIVSGMISQAMGNVQEARIFLEQAIESAREFGLKNREAMARMVLGRVMAESDASQIAAAEEQIVEGLKVVEDQQLKPDQAVGHLLLGEAYAIAGQKDKALASLGKAHGMCQEMGMDYWLARTKTALERLKA